MEIEIYKWYKASEILPEETLLPKDKSGIQGWFIITLPNGDLSCATRYIDGNRWYWDTDNEYNDSCLESEDATYWMSVESPK